MVRVYNPSAQETKAGGTVQILEASLDCITRLLLKNGRYGKDLKGRGKRGEERGKEGEGRKEGN